MNEWVMPLGVGGLLLASFGLRFIQHRRVRFTPELRAALGRLGADAVRRRHRVVTIRHVAVALLAEPDVARPLEEGGISLKDLYDDVEHLLPPPGELPTGIVNADEAFERLFRASAHGVLSTAGPVDVFRALLGAADEELREIFEKYGLRAASWPPTPTGTVDGAPPVISESGPYRSGPNAGTAVVIWNDEKTTMRFVINLLQITFGIVEPHATKLMITCHRDGSTVVGRYERAEAERLASHAMELAKKEGFPMRVTAERH